MSAETATCLLAMLAFDLFFGEVFDDGGLPSLVVMLVLSYCIYLAFMGFA